MKAVVRPLVDTDLEGFDRLRTLLYPDRPETFDTDRYFSIWHWLGTHPLADQMHRWVVATEEGEVVGHLAALPQYYRINGSRVVAHTPADYMVLPEYGFHAITLMRKFFRTCENCVACDVAPAAISIETGLGAEEAGRLQHAAKLQNVAGLPALPTSIPVPLTRLFNWGLQAVDRALTATMFADHLRVEVLEGFDETFDELFESVAAGVACVPDKDTAFLRWRYAPDSPQSPVTVLGVRERETLLGYAVLWLNDTRYASNLLDLMTRPGRDDVARALLKGAIEHFARAGVHIIRYRFLESPTSPRAKDVWRLGFLPRNSRRHTLLVKFADHNLHKAALDPANWSYTTGDGEASFFF
jgi:Acetyltransferase (GNAT) domain